jgi:phage/plasmid-like protein (TIGR03299 family)
MSHEITKTDGLVLAQQGAWHGMGVVVQEAPTPLEALKIAGIESGVKPLKLKAYDDEGNEYLIDSHVANYRVDNNQMLGIVSAAYQIVQNIEVAEFCEALQITDQKVKVETAGTIRGGKRMWMLCRGESFDVANGDTMFPYLLVSNGHDGGAPFRVTPTTIRAVCSNTLHMVVPRKDTGELLSSAFVMRHGSKIMDRIEEAKEALKNYATAQQQMKEVADRLAAKLVDTEAMQKFFFEAYQTEFGEIPTNPTNKREENRKAKAMSALGSFTRRFDDEKLIAGASAWNMLNAFTGLVQHDMKAKGADDTNRVVRRVESNLFGLNQKRSQAALRLAYAGL